MDISATPRGEREAEEVGNHVQRKSPLGCRMWSPGYGAGIPQLPGARVLLGI